MMQGTPYNLALDEYPPFLSQETDTATPRTLVPIYYIHDLKSPFCQNGLCVCQRGRKAAARMVGYISEGMYLLEDAQTFFNGIPVLCQLYGHSWELTEQSDVKACQLCHIRGYCPGCTPIAPIGAQPFSCTTHTRQHEVQ